MRIKPLLLSLFLALAITPAEATVAFVNKVQTASITGTVISSGAMNLTAGNFVVCGVVTNRGNASFTIADTATNTLHLVTGSPYQPGSTWGVYIYYVYNATGNASDVFTLTTTGGSFSSQLVISCTQFSGLPTTDPSTGVLANAETTPPSGAINSGSLTLTGSQGVVYAAIVIDDTGGAPVFTAGSGFTAQLMDGTSNYDYFRDEYKIVSTSTAATATVTGTMYPNDISAAMFQTSGGTPAGKALFHAIP